MKVADQIVEQLQAAGVRRIYGIVGDSLNPIVDAVRRTGGAATGGIDWIHVRHEEAAAFAAAADAQLTGELAVCAGSCGPGNLHLINGLYDANRSGAPVLAIASHIPTTQIGVSFFQATHPEKLFDECSVYAEMISAPAQSPRVVETAIQHAVALKGVSVVTVPGDLTDEEVTADVPLHTPVVLGQVQPQPQMVQQLADAINQAEKVAIFCGIGVQGAHDEVIELAGRINAPVGHTLRGKDFIQYDNPYDVGMTGLLGYGAAAQGIEDADLLVLLGTDFPYDQFLPNTRTAQVDVAAQKLGRRTNVDIAVHGEVLPTLQMLLPLVQPKRKDKFLKEMLKKHKRIVEKGTNAYTRNAKKLSPIHPEYAMAVLDDVASDDAVFTADTGMCNVWTARYVTPNGRRRLIGSFLHGSMANALPHAIGAQFAYPQRQVISVSGDGGLSMLLGELLTIATYQLPVTVVCFNNSTLGMVKLEMLVEGLPASGTEVPDANYAAVAQAIGIKGIRVEEGKDLEKAYREALDHPGPALVEVVTDPNALSIPPEVTLDQVFGFATAMSRTVFNDGAGEVVSMARSNLRNIPRR
ncbi:pyruvate dehydrogenase [Luteococcus sp. Sow4_B9]|uniref:pyruvate dehydrogenase n=1 Tax=Luteococcus sp. Sow4_B9 TaxID=3438792 RepID=UPI003F9610BD